jgi:hypothetical protein
MNEDIHSVTIFCNVDIDQHNITFAWTVATPYLATSFTSRQPDPGRCQRRRLVGAGGTCTPRSVPRPPFPRLPPRARVQAMDAGCGSSTSGHWDGPVTCKNLTGLQRAKPHGERFHMNTMHYRVWAMLPSAPAVL